MKRYPKLDPKKTKGLASRVAGLLYERIQNNYLGFQPFKEDEFIRESELYMLFGVFDDIELDKESTNEIFFYINDLFKFSPPMMRYKYIEAKGEKYKGYKERIFEFTYGSNIEEMASIVRAIKYSESKLDSVREENSKFINCVIDKSIYKDIYVLTKLKSENEFTENKDFVFNSFYTSISEGEELAIIESDFKVYHINGKELYYNTNELEEFEMSQLENII